jgi:hypothetical protein
MRVQLNKIFGSPELLTFDEFNFAMDIGIGTTFTVPMQSVSQASLELIEIPVDTRGIPPGAQYVIDGKWILGNTDRFSQIIDHVVALRIEIDGVDFGVDLQELPSASHDGTHPQLQSPFDTLMPKVLTTLFTFYESYRHAKYDVDSEAGRDPTQAIDATRRMPPWAFRTALLYLVTDEQHEVYGSLAEGKTRAWSDSTLQQLRGSIEQYLSSGVDFVRTRAFDAEQSFYDGDWDMAVVNSFGEHYLILTVRG